MPIMVEALLPALLGGAGRSPDGLLVRTRNCPPSIPAMCRSLFGIDLKVLAYAGLLSGPHRSFRGLGGRLYNPPGRACWAQ